ncbi:MAG TPA: helix-turn-helix domain-containing protein, partial [Reyranella sp.]
MGNENKEFRTPGQLIESLLGRKGWTKKTLAVILGVSEARITRLTGDKQPVDAKVAIALEEVFGEPAERFLALQKEYELAQARIVTNPDPGRATRAALYGDLPLADM